mmetsp:Transcript_26466/g.85499  ORF Transcript_26466/g.85499 Transcript_26466/m.85499 type:complete len:339 (+) Transcript_26466:861-1877(+)
MGHAHARQPSQDVLLFDRHRPSPLRCWRFSRRPAPLHALPRRHWRGSAVHQPGSELRPAHCACQRGQATGGGAGLAQGIGPDGDVRDGVSRDDGTELGAHHSGCGGVGSSHRRPRSVDDGRLRPEPAALHPHRGWRRHGGSAAAQGGQRAERPRPLPKDERAQGWFLPRAPDIRVQRLGLRRRRRLHARPPPLDEHRRLRPRRRRHRHRLHRRPGRHPLPAAALRLQHWPGLFAVQAGHHRVCRAVARNGRQCQGAPHTRPGRLQHADQGPAARAAEHRRRACAPRLHSHSRHRRLPVQYGGSAALAIPKRAHLLRAACAHASRCAACAVCAHDVPVR